MIFELWPALIAGALAGFAMVIMRTLMKKMGMNLRMSITRMWGVMMGLSGSAATFIGFWIHIVVSALIALLYVWIFGLIGVTGYYWVWGILGGFIHWFIAGVFMGMIPTMQSGTETEPAPGFLISKLGGQEVVTFIIGHLMYGVLTALLYAYFAGLYA